LDGRLRKLPLPSSAEYKVAFGTNWALLKLEIANAISEVLNTEAILLVKTGRDNN